ncbi:MAG: bacteriohemerythrin [Coriobacteriia bacterium]|nr:bacteriohemerythrin [Coriobacteriia bacterium]
MDPIIWNERLATGDAHIDGQHAELHDLVMELGILADEDPDPVRLGEVLFDVLAYASTHFEDEEALMERMGFPGLERQRELHTGFKSTVEEFARRFSEGDTTLTAALVQENLQQWLLTHVWEEDLQFAAYGRQRGN